MLYELDEIFDAALKTFRNNFADIPIHVDVLGTDQKYGPNMIVDKLIKLTIGEKQIQYYGKESNNAKKEEAKVQRF